jgi:hypothetical protein
MQILTKFLSIKCHRHQFYPSSLFCQVTWSRYGNLTTTTAEVELLYPGTGGAGPGPCTSYRHRSKESYTKIKMHAKVDFDQTRKSNQGIFASRTQSRLVDEDGWRRVHTWEEEKEVADQSHLHVLNGWRRERSSSRDSIRRPAKK